MDDVYIASTHAMADPVKKKQIAGIMAAEALGRRAALQSPHTAATLAVDVYGKSLELVFEQEYKAVITERSLVTSSATTAHGLFWMTPATVNQRTGSTTASSPTISPSARRWRQPRRVGNLRTVKSFCSPTPQVPAESFASATGACTTPSTSAGLGPSCGPRVFCFECDPDDEARRRVAAAFAKAEAPVGGVPRGYRTTMLSDADINYERHARAALGAVITSMTGDARVFVSGGTEHQAGPGMAPIAAIIRVES